MITGSQAIDFVSEIVSIGKKNHDSFWKYSEMKINADFLREIYSIETGQESASPIFKKNYNSERLKQIQFVTENIVSYF
jgi:hypothetical protein